MTVTDELRALLDARGAEWAMDMGGIVEWVGADERLCRAYARPDPLTVDVAMLSVTPAQAVEATLGRGTCYDKGNIERFICSECGCRLKLQDDEWEPTMWLDDGAATVPRFCPWCGREVMEG